MLFVPTVTHSALRNICIRHRETTGRIHVPQSISIEIRLLVVRFQTFVSDNGMIINDIAQRIEDIIGILLAVDIVIIALRNSSYAGDDVCENRSTNRCAER